MPEIATSEIDAVYHHASSAPYRNIEVPRARSASFAVGRTGNPRVCGFCASAVAPENQTAAGKAAVFQF